MAHDRLQQLPLAFSQKRRERNGDRRKINNVMKTPTAVAAGTAHLEGR
jgi:hypothetical protein